MKRERVVLFMLCVLGLFGYFSSEVMAIDAYFDSEISTDLDYTPNSGTLLVRMIDEEVPQIIPDIEFKRTIYVEIIFDASKTMGEPDINGIRKIDVAKQLVSILVKHFPQEDTQFALRLNGAALPNNCLDSELVVPFSHNNGQHVMDVISGIQPTGLSPLAYSLRQVLNDFSGTVGSKVVFVITDGAETCDVEPVDTCTVTMDMLVQAEFEGDINILGVNTIYDDVRALLSCLAARGNGKFLDSNRNSGREFAQLIRDSSQLTYSVSRILDPDVLSEGKILGLLNRRIGDATELADTVASQSSGTDVSVTPGIIQRSTTGFEIQDIDVVELPETQAGFSSHELPPGVYKIEFTTTPPLAAYFTIDQGQELTVGMVRSGNGFDLYDRVHLALGNLYYDREEIEEAVEEYQKVLEYDPRNVDAHLNLGIIYQDILADEEKAALHYKTYIELQGPRLEDVSKWFREVQGLPSEEEELERRTQEREEILARQQAAELAAEEEAAREKERQKALDAYNEILTANPNIRELSEDDVISGADKLAVIVSSATSASRAEKVALDVGKRMMNLLGGQPEVYIYRENDSVNVVIRAIYDDASQQYVIVE
ncbi:hypothetical protein CSA56_13615 [candidate division KSB3 bacterium]|uniref:VWFA domain-containing protein n=1 Tax=candidate division KSB3 bacterium TaxID=2044937 RepID=A0A2G6KBB7_9BACT|nr:MAG: hypothetical protein CSA56_13615 [candidate division KSB3 bacterium]